MTILTTQIYAIPGDTFVQESVFVYATIHRVIRSGNTYSAEEVASPSLLSQLGFLFTPASGRIDFKVPFFTPPVERPARRDYERIKIVYEIP